MRFLHRYDSALSLDRELKRGKSKRTTVFRNDALTIVDALEQFEVYTIELWGFALPRAWHTV